MKERENREWARSKIAVFCTNGASSHSSQERQKEDYYATAPAAVEHLMKLETFNQDVWECACGEGHMSRILEQHGYRVKSSDLIDRGFGDIADFLAIDNLEWNGDIITNPPYKYAQEFVEKALQIIPNGNKVAMFLKLTFLEGQSRRGLFRQAPPSLYM